MDGESGRTGDGASRVSDEELVRAFYDDGDEAAFAELYERFRRKLYALGLRFGLRHEDAEGRVQDTLVRFYETRAKKLEGPAGWFDSSRARFGTWLYRVHYNNCVDFMRRMGDEPLSFEHADSPDDGGGPSPAELVASPDRQSDDLLVDAELSRALREAVDALPYEMRVAVSLYYFWEEHSGARPTQQQIGEVVGCSAPTVNRLLKKGHEIIKRTLIEKGLAEARAEAVDEVASGRIGNA